MEQLLSKIRQYKEDIQAEKVEDNSSLEAFRIKYLGTKGVVKAIMSEMKNVTAENKKEAGRLLNEFKVFTEETFETFKNKFSQTTDTKSQDTDLTLPGYAMSVGARHPISLVQNKII